MAANLRAKLINGLGLPADADDAAIDAALDKQLGTKAAPSPAANSDITRIVDKAVKDGKISETHRGIWLAQLAQNRESAQRLLDIIPAAPEGFRPAAATQSDDAGQAKTFTRITGRKYEQEPPPQATSRRANPQIRNASDAEAEIPECDKWAYTKVDDKNRAQGTDRMFRLMYETRPGAES